MKTQDIYTDYLIEKSKLIYSEFEIGGLATKEKSKKRGLLNITGNTNVVEGPGRGTGVFHTVLFMA